jgi:hypothetical protein
MLNVSGGWLCREPISNDKRLAVAMALHPSLGESSSLFLIASIPTNPLKAGKFSVRVRSPGVTSALQGEELTPSERQRCFRARK